MDMDQEPIEAEVVSETPSDDQEVADALFDQVAGNTKPYLKRVISFGCFFGLSLAGFIAMLVLRFTVLQQGWVTGMAVILGVIAFVTGVSFYLFLRIYRMVKKATDIVRKTATMSEQEIVDAFRNFTGVDPNGSNSIGTAPIDAEVSENE